MSRMSSRRGIKASMSVLVRVANSELSCELAMQIGRAAAVVLAGAGEKRPKILIGMDPRISSNMLESALAAGICSVGADVLRIGVVPTPAVAYLVGKYGADAGVMISASHNSCEYNEMCIRDRCLPVRRDLVFHPKAYPAAGQGAGFDPHYHGDERPGYGTAVS